MPPDAPAVSVILPTYNRADTLPRAVKSVLAQTFGDYELLIIDDGSTDRTPSVVEQLEDPRIRYIRLARNRGVSAARNRGFSEARGEFIAFLDSDDEWLPRKLERQVDLLRQAPDSVGMAYSGALNVHPGGRRSEYLPRDGGDLLPVLLIHNVIHATPSVLLRRAVVHAVGDFDETLPAIEDYDYWLRVAKRSQIAVISEPLVVCHDQDLPDRKSRDTDANLAAREQFYRKHGESMRRAGVAHLFLFGSARRQLHRLCWQPRIARRLILEGLRRRPNSIYGYRLLFRTFLPRSVFVTAAQMLKPIQGAR